MSARGILVRITINAIALAVTAYLLPGIHFREDAIPFGVALAADLIGLPLRIGA